LRKHFGFFSNSYFVTSHRLSLFSSSPIGLAVRATPRRRSTPCSPRLRSLPSANQTGAIADGVTPGFHTPCSVPSDGQLPTTLGPVYWSGWRRLVIWPALMLRCRVVRVGCCVVVSPRAGTPYAGTDIKSNPGPPRH
jgi:hypothetical protein